MNSAGHAQREASLTPEQALAGLRASGAPSQNARSLLTFVAGDVARDAARAQVAHLLAASLRPPDHAITRWLLEQESARLKASGAGASEALYMLVAALARFADARDALPIWRARAATPQTRVGVDVEQLGRLGVDRARRYLRALGNAAGPDAREAAEALAWLEDGLAAGAFADLAGYFAWADERFGLHVSGPV